MKAFLEDTDTETWEGPNSVVTNTYVWGETSVSGQDYSLRTKRYRYIRYATGKEELYDHKYDKYEWKNIIDEPAYQIVRENMSIHLSKRIFPQGTPTIILNDPLLNDSKLLNISTNFKFVQIQETDLNTYDPEQLQRTDKNEATIVYDATDVHSFQIDFWSTKNHSLEQTGLLKAYIANSDEIYSEILLNVVADTKTTGYRRRYFYTSESPISDAKYLKIELSEGASSWIGLIGKVQLFDNGMSINNSINVDVLEIDTPIDLFQFSENTLRTNSSGAPYFTDNLSDISKTFRTSGTFYFSDVSPENFAGDSNRLVRSDSNANDLELVYQAANITYFRLEFWSSNSSTIETAQEKSGNISAYVSENTDSNNDYTQISLKYLKIKQVGDWTLYAVVPKNELETSSKFVTFKISGGTGSMWSGQYGAVHLYNNSLNNEEKLLRTTTYDSDIHIYPNPVKDFIHFRGITQRHELQCFNALGEIFSIKKTNNTIDVRHLSQGIYFLKIDKGNQISIVRFIKK